MNQDLLLPEANRLGSDVTPGVLAEQGRGNCIRLSGPQRTRWDWDWVVASPSTYVACMASQEQSLCPPDVRCLKMTSYSGGQRGQED